MPILCPGWRRLCKCTVQSVWHGARALKEQITRRPCQLKCCLAVMLVQRQSYSCVGKQRAASFWRHVTTTTSWPLSRYARRLKAFLPAHKIKKRPSEYIGSHKMRGSEHCTMLLLLKIGKNQCSLRLHRCHQQELGSSGTFSGNKRWPSLLRRLRSLMFALTMPTGRSTTARPSSE